MKALLKRYEQLVLENEKLKNDNAELFATNSDLNDDNRDLREEISSIKFGYDTQINDLKYRHESLVNSLRNDYRWASDALHKRDEEFRKLSNELRSWKLAVLLKDGVPADSKMEYAMRLAKDDPTFEHKIANIKNLRDKYNLGLKEAKDLYEDACVLLGTHEITKEGLVVLKKAETTNK